MSRAIGRRGLVGPGASLLLLAGAAMKAAPPAEAAGSPDAELLRVCAEFDALERQYVALHGVETIEEEHANEPLINVVSARQQHLLDRLCELRATTMQGLRAKAETLANWDPTSTDEDPGRYWDDRMVASLVCDILAQAGA